MIADEIRSIERRLDDSIIVRVSRKGVDKPVITIVQVTSSRNGVHELSLERWEEIKVAVRELIEKLHEW